MARRTTSQITFPKVLLLAVALSGCVAVVKIPMAPATTFRPWPASAACPAPDRSAADAARVLHLVNLHRARAGLGALSASAALSDAAHRFACDLARRTSLSHTGSDGADLRERLARAGAVAGLMAENVAAGQVSPEEVVADWMASPHHRDNILRPDLTQLGLGQADGAMPVWVLDLSS